MTTELRWLAEANRITLQLAREHDARRIETGHELRDTLTTFGPFYEGLVAERDRDHAGVSAIDSAPAPPPAPTPATVATVIAGGLLFTAREAGSSGNRITVTVLPPYELSPESKRQLEEQGIPTSPQGFGLTIAQGDTTERFGFVWDFGLRQHVQSVDSPGVPLEFPVPALTTPSKLVDVVWTGPDTPAVGTYRLAGGADAILHTQGKQPTQRRAKDDAAYVFRLDAFRSYTLPELGQIVSAAIVSAEQWLAAGGG